ncbi:unnamed protein product [Oppiella nova]|uniref:Uncharacterized protein n=2 Tax=Oppiella nova TaxID=334625 RepID=A0A7R9M3Z7_9ACAR|nr:unnamed protein product [Oppiella nova]CAG2170337.1 unnamed protein product [Oppiella nova]
MNLNLCLYIKLNAIVLTFISIVETNVQNCSIGVLTDSVCAKGWVCVQWSDSHPNGSMGRCVCQEDCPKNETIVSTVKPLPIYSVDDNSNSRSVVVVSVLSVVMSALVVVVMYYVGVRKGMFREVWRRAFTPQQIEHQLLDRSPQSDETNDSEAIA